MYKLKKKIMFLVALFLKKLVKRSMLKDVSFGIVQTAYANGNSTNFINEKLVKIIFLIERINIRKSVTTIFCFSFVENRNELCENRRKILTSQSYAV